MRNLGYEVNTQRDTFGELNQKIMPKEIVEESSETIQLKEKIKQLEKALVESELRAVAMETIIYQKMDECAKTGLVHELLLKEVHGIGKKHPRIGTKKWFDMLNDFRLEHKMKMGRDTLFNLLSINGLLVRRRRRAVRTTQSHHWLKKYPNLIKEFNPKLPKQLWVSDITY